MVVAPCAPRWVRKPGHGQQGGCSGRRASSPTACRARAACLALSAGSSRRCSGRNAPHRRLPGPPKKREAALAVEQAQPGDDQHDADRRAHRCRARTGARCRAGQLAEAADDGTGQDIAGHAPEVVVATPPTIRANRPRARWRCRRTSPRNARRQKQPAEQRAAEDQPVRRHRVARSRIRDRFRIGGGFRPVVDEDVERGGIEVVELPRRTAQMKAPMATPSSAMLSGTRNGRLFMRRPL